MVNLIRNSAFFKELDDQDFHAILRCFNARIQKFNKHENIVTAGDEALSIYIIASGSARSYVTDINGKEIINREYYIDDIFGIEYISKEMEYYLEELVALEETTVIICNGYRFLNPCQNRCKRHIDCQKITFQKMSEMLLSSTTRVHTMCQSKTRSKLLYYLQNQKEKNKKYFKIPFNQSELATYLGVERSALSVELNALKKEGIIDYNEKSYRIKKKTS